MEMLAYLGHQPLLLRIPSHLRLKWAPKRSGKNYNGETGRRHTFSLIRSTVPWKGKHTKSDQELTVDVRGCEMGPVSEVTA